ncbi:hypothetical protein PVL29_005486 [Vitis rotundifolia]|uniref:soluble epoxide hydrolase n=1 Tax=Vitis rotundifolia TaxID=103349 RepID=A0AA39A3A6_VITRO|nr:hypothetical protein PVL29_005486 [Vitis rotundifolia]
MEGVEHRTVKANGINIHVAEKGQGPIILFLHGFPELWYSWRHQIHAFASLGYRALAPDLRGYGDSDAPADVGSYTCFHVVGHDWGAIIAWYLCLFRPDRVKALVNMSVPFLPRNPLQKPIQIFRALNRDNFYICRFQEPGMEAALAEIGPARVLKSALTSRKTGPPRLPEGQQAFAGTPDVLPSWLSEEEVNYYVSKYERTGFTGGLNYYRNMDLYVTFILNFTQTGNSQQPGLGVKSKCQVSLLWCNLDLTYNTMGFKEFMKNDEFRKHVPFLGEIVVMEGVGHCLHEEKPDEVNQHIHEFFQKF